MLLRFLRRLLNKPALTRKEELEICLQRYPSHLRKLAIRDPERKGICVDFDNFLYPTSTSPWKGSHRFDSDPIPGAGPFLRSLLDREYEVIIHTARLGVGASNYVPDYATQPVVFEALVHHFRHPEYRYAGVLPQDLRYHVLPGKPAAKLYLDDRALFSVPKGPEEYQLLLDEIPGVQS